MNHRDVILAEVTRRPVRLKDIQLAHPMYQKADIKHLLQRLMYRGLVVKRTAYYYAAASHPSRARAFTEVSHVGT